MQKFINVGKIKSSLIPRNQAPGIACLRFQSRSGRQDFLPDEPQGGLSFLFLLKRTQVRLMLEHYLKTRLGIAISQQIRGDELIAKHSKMLSPAVVGVLPLVTVAWERLSYWPHTRTGEAKDYQTQRDAICKHFEVLEILGDKATQQSLTGY
jgi:hypothetical protein